MRLVRVARTAFAVLSLSILLVACPPPFGGDSDGRLVIALSDGINQSTLLPAIDLSIAEYRIEGRGPDGASFSRTTADSEVTVDHLAFGEWQVTVTALNGEGTIIGSGAATAQVVTGDTSVVAVTVVPIDGFGTLDVAVSWNADDLQIPTIIARLIPASGAEIPLDFTVSGSRADLVGATVPTGYHTLSIQLLDNGLVVAGVVEVARIVNGAPTVGSYTFDRVNQPGGTIAVEITPDLADPLSVTIEGATDQLEFGSAYPLQTSVAGVANPVVVWYVDGAPVATGVQVDLGPALEAGFRRVDVTAFSPDGRRAGSATAAVTVFDVSGIHSGTTVMVWRTDLPGESAPDQITLPLTQNGSHAFVVDWGDGSRGEVLAWDDPARTHTYDTPGTYVVTMQGKVAGWSFSPEGDPATYGTGDAAKLLEVRQWGKLSLENTTAQFAGARNLVITAGDAPRLSTTVSLDYAFLGNESLQRGVAAWDVSSVTSMVGTFQGATRFNEDLAGWNVVYVTSMASMFQDAVSFNGDISGWVPKSLTDTTRMFAGASSFNSDISGWNPRRLLSMTEMFRDAVAFDRNIGAWNVGLVPTFVGLFAGAGLSTPNYDLLLQSWSQQKRKSAKNVVLDAGSSQYSAAAEAARQLMIDRGWTINDGGPAPTP